jgi:pectate lyase
MFKTRADYDNVVVSPNPLTPLYSDDFEIRIAPYWQRPAGLWDVVSDDGINDVYRQSSVAAGASSIIGVPTGDQIVEARAQAISFDGADRWFGIVSRYQDQQNYYYITLRNSNTILLRKLVNGVPTTLDSAPLTVATGTWYTLRLEAIGSSLRAYVNNQQLLEAEDTTFASGIYGFAMYKTASKFDDLRVFEP